MKYQCKTIPISHLLIGVSGPILPLCDRCKTKDCSNNIQFKAVSTLGITSEHRVIQRGDDCMFVINCDGYSE